MTLNLSLNYYSLENIAFGSSDIVVETIKNWVEYHVNSVTYGALPLTFWLATKQFELWACKSGNKTQGENILQRFKELKIITRLINTIWAQFVLIFVLECSILLIWLHQRYLDGNTIWFIYLSAKIGFLILGVTIMADGCSIVSYLQLSIIILRHNEKSFL